VGPRIRNGAYDLAVTEQVADGKDSCWRQGLKAVGPAHIPLYPVVRWAVDPTAKPSTSRQHGAEQGAGAV
jgi:hypothetical protein